MHQPGEFSNGKQRDDGYRGGSFAIGVTGLVCGTVFSPVGLILSGPELAFIAVVQLIKLLLFSLRIIRVGHAETDGTVRSCRRAAGKQVRFTYSYASSYSCDCRSRSSSFSCSWVSFVMNIFCKGAELDSALTPSSDFCHVLALAKDLGRASFPLLPVLSPSLARPRPPSLKPAPLPRPLPGLKGEPGIRSGNV